MEAVPDFETVRPSTRNLHTYHDNEVVRAVAQSACLDAVPVSLVSASLCGLMCGRPRRAQRTRLYFRPEGPLLRTGYGNRQTKLC